MADQARASRVPLYLGAVLILFGVCVVMWGSASFTDHVPLVVKGREPPQSVSFRCPAILGQGGEPEASEHAIQVLQDRRLTRPPCAPFREQRRVLAAVDLAVAAAGLGLLLRLRMRFAQPTMPPPMTSSSA